MSSLAILGGSPVRQDPFPAYVSTGAEEKEAVNRVLDSGILSRFLGVWHDDFLGGKEVRNLEDEWAKYFNVKHAIAVNSATSGLYCAVGATCVEPGDEIIVSPYTMSASATAPLVFNAIPVFADIEEEYYCLSPESVEERITGKTKAIIIVDIFGLPYDVDAINKIADKHGLIVIEDCAQAPGAKYKDKFAGTLADIGVFSLNYHKHIHCGEGGIVVTDNDELGDKIRLIRNHAEAVVEAKGVSDLRNMIGFNFRMTEIEASISSCQLSKLEELNVKRYRNVKYIESALSDIAAISLPKVRDHATHAYYLHACKYDKNVAGIDRNIFINAVKAELPYFNLRETEGVKLGSGYVKPLYLQPMFQNKIAYGSQGFPFNLCGNKQSVDYSKGSCPVVERMHFNELFTHEFIVPSMEASDLDDVLEAFYKVWDNIDDLRKMNK